MSNLKLKMNCPTSFQEILDFMGKKESRTIGHNTVMTIRYIGKENVGTYKEQNRFEVYVEYHHNRIITYSKEYIYVNMCEWEIATIRDLINRLTPFQVYRRKHKQFIAIPRLLCVYHCSASNGHRARTLVLGLNYGEAREATAMHMEWPAVIDHKLFINDNWITLPPL